MVDRDRDDPLAEYLDAFEASEQPSLAEARRTWANIRAATRPKRSRTAWWVGALAAAVLAALAVGRWVERPDRVEAVPLEQAPYDAERELDRSLEPERHVVTTEPSTPAPAVPVVTESAPEPAAPHVQRRRPAVPDEPSPSPSALAEETAAFDEIHVALSAGHYQRALELVDAHERRFARGVFRHERKLAQARALCGLGRADDARGIARAFVSKHPQSHLAERFAAVCPP